MTFCADLNYVTQRRALARALASDELPPGIDPATLLVLQIRGSYSCRPLSYFRVFDPLRAAERAIALRIFGDFDTHPELVLGSGHVERDGAVVLSWPDPAQRRYGE